MWKTERFLHSSFGLGGCIADFDEVVPPLLGAAADANNSTAIAMSVPLAFFVATFSYAICVNFVPAYRDVADKFATAKVEMDGQPGVLADEKTTNGRSDEEKGGVVEREDVK